MEPILYGIFIGILLLAIRNVIEAHIEYRNYRKRVGKPNREWGMPEEEPIKDDEIEPGEKYEIVSFRGSNGKLYRVKRKVVESLEDIRCDEWRV